MNESRPNYVTLQGTPAAPSAVKPMMAYAVVWAGIVHMAKVKRLLFPGRLPAKGWACRFPVTEAAVMMLDTRGAMN